MKVFMMTDLEGVAGVASFQAETYPDARYYDDAKRLLTAEVNAAVEGMLAAGVTDIIILDGHGPGAIWVPDLRPEPLIIHGRPLSPTWRDEVKGCDAAIFIGQHAMAGVATGNMNHTFNSRSIDYVKLNGQPVGEIAMFALHCGRHNVPVIYLSGDDDACQEVEALIPGVATTSVKRGLGRNSVIGHTPVRAREMIRNDIEQAVRRHGDAPVQPFTWDGPYVVEKRFFQSDTADAAMTQPGVERIDGQTVCLRGDRLEDVIYW